MGSLPRAKAGVGSAVNDTTRQMGGAVGVAVLGSLLSSRYAPQMTSRLSGRVPDSLLGSVNDSIGQTLGVARHAPARLQPVIVSAAKASFVSGLHVASLVAASVLLLAVAGVAKWLPARAHDDERNPDVAAAAAPADPAPAVAPAD